MGTEINELDRFIIWCKMHGHYGYVRPLVDNYHKWQESRKENEVAALRNIARADD